MIETLPTSYPKTVGFKVSGKLHDEDYRSFVPKVETILAAEGKLRLFIQFEDFHGWDLHAFWDDAKFTLKHYADFDRIAMVGDRRWEKWMAQACKPFTKAKVRYFDAAQVDDAWNWLREDEKSMPEQPNDPPRDPPIEPPRDDPSFTPQSVIHPWPF